MKKLILFFFLTVILFACKKNLPQATDSKNADYEKAESFYAKNTDSAYYYFNKVATSGADRLDVAYAYNYMAVIQSDAGDYFGAQESLMQSLHVLEETNEKHFSCLASNYNELGTTSLNLKKYKQALAYYDHGLKFTDDATFRSIILNNKAIAYQKLGNYAQAIRVYERIIPNYKEHPREYARALSNITRTRWLQNPNYPAAPSLLRALHIRKAEKDDWGLNASFSHLADYYMQKKPDSALVYARQMYAVARKIDSPDDQLEALQKLIKLSTSIATKNYFQTYQTLSDSLQTARNAAKNQFAIIRYETEKSKADNLKLLQENTEKKYQILIRDVMLATGIVIFTGLLISAFRWDKRKTFRLQMEAEHAMRESQLRTSKRVHDVVANGLYRVMTEIENQDTVDRESVLDRIEDLYEKSRDISYEQPQQSYENFQEKVSALLKSFATAETKVLIAGNTAQLWQKVSPAVKFELEHILQELMVNMKKHSHAEHVALRFEDGGSQINLHYTDDGVGLPADRPVKNGLRNTGNRIEHIQGSITFDTDIEKGLKIHLSFPCV